VSLDFTTHNLNNSLVEAKKQIGITYCSNHFISTKCSRIECSRAAFVLIGAEMLIQSLSTPQEDPNMERLGDDTELPTTDGGISADSSTHIDPWEDVFEGHTHSSQPPPITSPTTQHTSILGVVSDVPRLQAAHSTAGYREGISASKERFIQEGFDEGYQLGAELGYLVGLIQGCLSAIATGAEKSGIDDDVKRRVREVVLKAESELDLRKAFGTEYFGSDGVWTYDVGRDEGEVSFRDVALAHPLVKWWLKELGDMSKAVKLDLSEEYLVRDDIPLSNSTMEGT
jgi:hypothetical protein